jgi:hypothetical protein
MLNILQRCGQAKTNITTKANKQSKPKTQTQTHTHTHTHTHTQRQNHSNDKHHLWEDSIRPLTSEQ